MFVPNKELIDAQFSFHPANGDIQAQHDAWRTACRDFAQLAREVLPDRPDTAGAIDMIRGAMFLGNAAIALEGAGVSE